MRSLLEIIDSKLLPWARDRQWQCIVGTGDALRKNELPDGVTITKKLPRGHRMVTKGERRRANPDVTTAAWPHDGLIEAAGAPIIICVYGGRVDFWAGDFVMHCGEGRFLLLPPGIRQDDGRSPHYDNDPKSPKADDFSDLLWIQRVGRIMRIWTCHCQGAVHGSQSGLQADFLNDGANMVMDSLMAEALAGQEDWQVVGRDYLCALLTILRRELNLGTMLISSRRIEMESRADAQADPIDQAKKYIRIHLREKVTIEKVAQHIFMSRAQFTQKFRQETGKSFTEYLTECRIEESKKLLCDSSWSVQRVSRVMGIRSTSYFCKLFAKEVGESPHAFRKNQSG